MKASEAGIPRVSVVCAWYNRADYLTDTMESLLAQTFTDYEIILINDGSTDPRVRRLLQGYAVDSRVLVHSIQNSGFVKAISYGVSLARAPIIAIQGAGDVSFPERLAKQYKLLKSDARLAGVICHVRSRTIGEGNDGSSHVINDQPDRFYHSDLMQRRNFITHGEMMFRKDIYDRVGGYRVPFTFAQDRDLWLRMSQHGDFATCPEVLYERRIFENGGVAADLPKIMSQRILSAFARDCARQRQIFGFDWVDIFGDQAPLFRPRSKLISKRLAVYSLACLLNNDIQGCKLFSKMSRNECLTPYSLLAQAVVLGASHSSMCKSIFRLMLSRTSIAPIDCPAALKNLISRK
ncbi:glycosyltransferase family 2 protein [Salinisphaera sp. T31B1]|uniref:glycosyltransferase family 2 protein n=1 Tax=Salinisphaera sp. T31B1 TaxID=727963 RepID=UPI0033424602